MQYALRLLTLESNPVLFRWPLQERRGERSRTICSCNHLETQRNSYGESKLEFSWLQEQTPATAMAF